MEQRLEKLSQWMRNQRVDVAWITSSMNVYYFTGCYVEPHERLVGLFVFADNDPIFVYPKLEERIIEAADWPHGIICYDDAQNPWKLIQKKFQHRFSKLRVVAIEKESLSYAIVEKLTEVLPNPEFVGVDKIIDQFRVVKHKNELYTLSLAAKFADEAMQIGVDTIREGCTELEVVAEIEFAMKKRGISEMAFQTITLFGNRTALPHGKPNSTRLQTGDFILIDLGVRVDGYCSDLTRTFVYQKSNKLQERMYSAVLQAQLNAIAGCKPYTRISEIDSLARSVISNKGWKDYFIHRTGHGLGLGIHEFPSIDQLNQESLCSGMVITIEPGIYIPNIGGVRIEDDLYITDDGVQVLTQYPKELQILDK